MQNSCVVSSICTYNNIRWTNNDVRSNLQCNLLLISDHAEHATRELLLFSLLAYLIDFISSTCDGSVSLAGISS